MFFARFRIRENQVKNSRFIENESRFLTGRRAGFGHEKGGDAMHRRPVKFQKF